MGNILIEKNVMVPMRDAVQLATDVYRPSEGGTYPVLLARSPYNKDLIGHGSQLGIAPDPVRMVQEGYVVVVQDTRGRAASEGTFYPLVNEAADGADTIAWAAAQPWSDGNVGLFGASYLGFTQMLAAGEEPKALRTMIPVVTTADYYEAPWYHQGGAFELGLSLNWAMHMAVSHLQRRLEEGPEIGPMLAKLIQATSDMPALARHLPLTDQNELRHAAPWYLDWLAHPTYDQYWRALSHKAVYDRITIPALHIGGWYDPFLGGTLDNYTGLTRRGGSDLARTGQRLIIGPWSHGNYTGQFAERNYGGTANAMAVDLLRIHTRWYDHYLKGLDNGIEREKPIRIFVMGLDQWREEDDWPLPDTRFHRYYLHGGGRANTAAGDGRLSTDVPGRQPEDVYLYDPRNPAPTIGGAILLADLMNVGPRDQWQAERREDVLCYTSPPLERSLEVTGPISLVLYASSSARDTDFTGKLVDVHPNGRAEILTEGILRARYRDSFATPKPLEPGRIHELRIDLLATANVFQSGHRLRLEVSSSNFPRYDRNLNTGGLIAGEREEDIVQAVNRVYHDAAHPSHLILPIIVRA